MKTLVLTFLWISVLPLYLLAQFETPVTWSWEASKISEQEYELVFKANVQDGWTLYSQFIDGDGPIPTSFEYELGEHFELIGTTQEEGNRKEGFDEIFKINVAKFLAGTVYFKQRVKVFNADLPIVGYLTFMTCDDEQCLPPKDIDFSFSFSVAAQAVDTNNKGTLASYPLAGVEIDHANEQMDCDSNNANANQPTGLWWVFVLGFGGGLLALLTPCVFPMVPLTVGYFTKSSNTKAEGIKNAIIYGLSIIVIYVSLGLLITGIFGADALNLLSTNAIFNIFFALLFILFALSFFGLIPELTLPSSWSNATDNLASGGGLIGIFFMAFTLSLVSFSCTGPIIGTLLVETATGGGETVLGRIPAGPLVGMLGFSLALALPFALFAAFPTWLKSLPKSGGWMSDVKVTLGFVELALALKFLSIADLTQGWKILPYEAFLLFWILCALGLALYFFGIIKFPVNYTKPKVTLPKGALALASLALVAYLSLGFQYSEVSKTFVTPTLMSGIAPPAGHSYIYPNSCPLNFDCYKDFQTGLATAKKQNKPILLDFTGHGCVNCRKMEDNIWNKKGIYELIRDKYVLVSLYVDERKKLEQPYASPIDGGIRRTVGDQWSDFQQLHFQQQSQPYYVLLSPDGKVLNKPVAYTPNETQYEDFLKCGLAQLK
jgi:thiol:disulfide interchange protein DsbD